LSVQARKVQGPQGYARTVSIFFFKRVIQTNWLSECKLTGKHNKQEEEVRCMLVRMVIIVNNISENKV